MSQSCRIDVFFSDGARCAMHSCAEITRSAEEYLQELQRKRSHGTLTEDEVQTLREYFLEFRIRQVLERTFPDRRSCCTINQEGTPLRIFSDSPFCERPLEPRIFSVIESPSGRGLTYDIDVLNGTSTEAEEGLCILMSIVVLVAAVSTLIYK